MKSVKWLIMVILTLGILSGCSFGKKAGSNGSEVIFWQPDSGTWIPIYEELIAKFEKEHPDIKIKMVTIPGDAYFDKLNTAFAANQGPDMWVNWYSKDEYERGYIASIDEFIAADNWDMEKYFQPITDASLKGYDGKYYGLPRDISMTTLLYNKDLFDKYNIPYPESDWTFNDFREIAKKITHPDDGVYGTDIVTGDYTLITGSPIIWNWNDGKDLVSEDGWNVTGLMDSPRNIELYKLAQEMVKEGSAAPPAVMETMSGTYGSFASGQIAMVSGYLWGFNVLADLDFKYGVVPFPGSDDGSQKYARNETVNFHMNAKSKKKEQTWEFMKFMTGEETGKVMAEDFTWAPPMVKSWTDAGLDKDPILSVFFNEGTKPTFTPLYLRNNKWWEASEPYAQAFLKMINPLDGEEFPDPEESLKEVTPQVQKNLDELKNQ